MNRGEWHTAAPMRFPVGRWELTFSGALRREKGRRTEFALPYTPQAPWPLTELFCFARLETIGAQTYIIYAFDEKRNPIF